MSGLFQGLLDWIFPPRCPFCHEFWSEKGRDFCPTCQNNLPWAFGTLAVQSGEAFRCCVSPLLYRDMVRDSFHRYKFYGQKAYAKVYGKLMAQCVIDNLGVSVDFLTWAPLSPLRKWRRGYDQAYLLARAIGQELGIEPVRTLRKAKHRKAQSRLGGGEEARRSNIQGAYGLASKVEVKGCSILLVDDIVTTGSTLSECAKVLLEAGAEQVVCVTLARAHH